MEWWIENEDDALVLRSDRKQVTNRLLHLQQDVASRSRPKKSVPIGEENLYPVKQIELSSRRDVELDRWIYEKEYEKIADKNYRVYDKYANLQKPFEVEKRIELHKLTYKTAARIVDAAGYDNVYVLSRYFALFSGIQYLDELKQGVMTSNKKRKYAISIVTRNLARAINTAAAHYLGIEERYPGFARMSQRVVWRNGLLEWAINQMSEFEKSMEVFIDEIKKIKKNVFV